MIVFFYFLYAGYFPNNWYQSFWFDSGGGSSAVKFRLENVDAIKVTQGQPGEAVVIILDISLERRW